jgi:hypothetical protein
MDIPIEHPAFAGRGLVVRTAGLFSGAKVVIDGQEVKGSFQKFPVMANSGEQIEIRLLHNGIDPVPKVKIGDSTIVIAKPLAWYEYLWIGLPIVLLFAGGAVGGGLGFAAIYSSARVFRSDRGTAAKYGITGAISIGSAVAFLVIAAAIQSAIHKR